MFLIASGIKGNQCCLLLLIFSLDVVEAVTHLLLRLSSSKYPPTLPSRAGSGGKSRTCSYLLRPTLPGLVGCYMADQRTGAGAVYRPTSPYFFPTCADAEMDLL